MIEDYTRRLVARCMFPVDLCYIDTITPGYFYCCSYQSNGAFVITLCDCIAFAKLQDILFYLTTRWRPFQDVPFSYEPIENLSLPTWTLRKACYMLTLTRCIIHRPSLILPPTTHTMSPGWPGSNVAATVRGCRTGACLCTQGWHSYHPHERLSPIQVSSPWGTWVVCTATPGVAFSDHSEQS